MALVLADRVRETTTVTGTGTATLLGAAPGYQSFSAVGNANTTYYVIANQSATEWEVGIGTYTASGTLLSRDTVLSSSNSGSLVNFSAGTKDVFVDYPAGKAVYEDAAGNVDGYPITGGTINNTTIGATTPSTGVFTTLTATGQTKLGGASGSNTVQVDTTTNTGQYTLFTRNNSINEQQIFSAGGSGSNLGFSASGLGDIWFRTNSGGQTQAKIAHTASAVNYHQLTGSATGSSPIHSAQGSDTNIGLNFSAKGSGIHAFTGNSGTHFAVRTDIASATNYWQVFGDSGSTPRLRTNGGNATLESGAALPFVFATNANSSAATQLQIAHTASAVNYVNIIGAATGGQVFVNAAGSDSNIGIGFTAKLFANTTFFAAGGFSQFQVGATASSVNFLQAKGGATGFGPVLSAQGTDTNIPLVLQPKGTGALQAQQTDSTATGGNARGANAVDWQTTRDVAARVASGTASVISGGYAGVASGAYGALGGGFLNSVSGVAAFTGGGSGNGSSGNYAFVGSGVSNSSTKDYSGIVSGQSNTASGYFNFIGGGFTNSGTANSAVTTQSGTMNGTTAVTLSGSNANIKVGQLISGTSITFPNTYVAAISGTSLTLSTAASGSSTSTLSFFTPHGVVVGGGNNQATGSYSFIGGGGDAGTAANRNVASGDYAVVVGGRNNTSSGFASFVGGGGFIGIQTTFPNTASGNGSVVVGGFSNTASNQGTFVGGGYANQATGIYSFIGAGARATTRSIISNSVFSSNSPITDVNGVSQAALLVLGRQTTDATATVLTSDANAASTTNQVILPNNSAYAFRGTVIANVTGGGNTKAWAIEGAIKRGANAASTALVGTATVTSGYADAGASTWAITATADTTNGGLAITFTGQASTTIRVVAKLETTEVTF